MDLVGGCEFFLHGLVGGREGRGDGCYVGKIGNGKGRGRWWWWGTSGADKDTWHSFSVQRHAGMSLSRTVRGRGVDRAEGRVKLRVGSV